MYKMVDISSETWNKPGGGKNIYTEIIEKDNVKKWMNLQSSKLENTK